VSLAYAEKLSAIEQAVMQQRATERNKKGEKKKSQFVWHAIHHQRKTDEKVRDKTDRPIALKNFCSITCAFPFCGKKKKGHSHQQGALTLTLNPNPNHNPNPNPNPNSSKPKPKPKPKPKSLTLTLTLTPATGE
jgi:hypothetical protein